MRRIEAADALAPCGSHRARVVALIAELTAARDVRMHQAQRVAYFVEEEFDAGDGVTRPPDKARAV